MTSSKQFKQRQQLYYEITETKTVFINVIFINVTINFLSVTKLNILGNILEYNNINKISVSSNIFVYFINVSLSTGNLIELLELFYYLLRSKVHANILAALN